MSASYIYYTWRQFDTIWRVCGDKLDQTSYLDTATFAVAVQKYNTTIIDWQAVPVYTRIVLPLSGN